MPFDSLDIWKARHLRVMLLLVSPLGCAHRSNLSPQSTAQVEELKIRFLSPGRANLALLISLPLNREEDVESVDYQLWLGGHYFSAGVNQVDVRVFPPASKFELDAPLIFRPLPMSDQPQKVLISVKGGIRLRGGVLGDVRRIFERELFVQLNQAPIFEDHEGD